MKKILIIEDDYNSYDKISDILCKNDISDRENIFPNFFNKTIGITDFNDEIKSLNIPIVKEIDDYIDDWSILKNLYTELNGNNYNSIFKFIYEKFRKVDLFILDIELISERNDYYGLEFYKYLVNNGVDKKNIFIVTTYAIKDINLDIDNEHIIQKGKDYSFLEILLAKITNATKK